MNEYDIIHYNDNFQYEGYLKDHLFYGKGKYIYRNDDGHSYLGYFIDHMKYGKGVYTWSDGTKYQV